MYTIDNEMEEKQGVDGVGLLKQIIQASNKMSFNLPKDTFELFGEKYRVHHVVHDGVWGGIGWSEIVEQVESPFPRFTCLETHAQFGLVVVPYNSLLQYLKDNPPQYLEI
jgi:hypothetical protein